MCYKTLQIDGRKKEKREPNIKEQPMACSTTYFVQLGCAAGSERVTTSVLRILFCPDLSESTVYKFGQIL